MGPARTQKGVLERALARGVGRLPAQPWEPGGVPARAAAQPQPDGPSFIDHLGSPAQSFAAPPNGGGFGVGVGVGAQGFADAGMGMMSTETKIVYSADIFRPIVL